MNSGATKTVASRPHLIFYLPLNFGFDARFLSTLKPEAVNKLQASVLVAQQIQPAKNCGIGTKKSREWFSGLYVPPSTLALKQNGFLDSFGRKELLTAGNSKLP